MIEKVSEARTLLRLARELRDAAAQLNSEARGKVSSAETLEARAFDIAPKWCQDQLRERES